MKKLIGATLLIILFICGGCKNEMATPKVEFILNLGLEPNDIIENYTILLSDDDGNILFYEKENQFTETISISIETQKKIHLTFGTILQNYFSLKTIKDIASDFSLSNTYRDQCEKLITKRAKLIIKDIEFPEKLFIGLEFANHDYDAQKKELTITGELVEDAEILISVLTSQDISHQSFLLTYPNWVESSSPDLLTYELNFAEFSPSTVKEVGLDKEGDWAVYYGIFWEGGNKFLNSMESLVWGLPPYELNSFQRGSKISLFTKSNFVNPEHHLEIFSSNLGNYEKIVGPLPEKITFYDPTIEIIDPSFDNFQVNLSENVDFSCTSFLYLTGNPNSAFNINSNYSVCQLNELEQEVKMIKFPKEFLKNEPFVSDFINKPFKTTFTAYQTNFEDIKDRFQKREIFEELRCVSYSRKTVSK